MYVYTGTGKSIELNAGGTAAAVDTPFTPWDDVLHRGWHEGVRENTLPAYYLLAKNGYCWGECDVRLTADNQIILCHDATITGTRDGVSVTLTVAESTADEITSLVLQTHKTYGDIHPCTLAQLLELSKTVNIGIVIDVKSAGNMMQEAGNKILAQTVVASGWADHVVYMPLSINAAKWIQEIDRNASFDFVSSVYDNNKESFISGLSGYQALLTGANTVGFDLNAAATGGEEVINAIHNAGLSVSFWGVGNTSFFPYNPLRVTYNAYSSAHLGRDYIRQQQSALATKYPAI